LVLQTLKQDYVYEATEEPSGRQVAVKKSRASTTLKRSTLQHETRVLQLLKGQAAIPTVHGYGHLENFEYMSMELLGPSIAEQQEKGGADVMLETVIRVVGQTVRTAHYPGFIPYWNTPISSQDYSTSTRLASCIATSSLRTFFAHLTNQPSKSLTSAAPNPFPTLKKRRGFFGSLYWTSLNSHNGIGQCISYLPASFFLSKHVDLGPRDDIESLALIALFLLRGKLPWNPRPHYELELLSQEIVRLMKSVCSGPILSTGLPVEFGDLLTYSRLLDFGRLPSYGVLIHSFKNLIERMGYLPGGGPLDWTPCTHEFSNVIVNEPEVSICDEDKVEGHTVYHLGEDSYCGMDIDAWERQGERDKDVTLPIKQEVFDSIVSLMVEVHTTPRRPRT